MVDGHFESGDIVRLKSGGPNMMVEREVPAPEPTVICIWFMPGAVKQRDRFIKTTVELVL